MSFPGFHIHPVLLLFLMVVWGAGSLYLFAVGVGELLQIDHEMTEVLAKGHAAVIAGQTPPVQIHVGWRLVTGTGGLGLALGFFRYHYWAERGI